MREKVKGIYSKIAIKPESIDESKNKRKIMKIKTTLVTVSE